MMSHAHIQGEQDSHKQPRILAMIPARGGSTRLPDKNMRMFAGRPLVAWSILQGLNALSVDEVWVSSDSERILELATNLGAKTYKRTEKENDDTPGYVPMLRLMQEVAQPEDVIIGLLPTSPLRKPDDIDSAVAKWFASPNHEEKLLQSVVEIHEDFRWQLVNPDCVIPLPASENRNCRFDGSMHISTRTFYETQIAAKGDVYCIPYLLDEWQGLDVNTASQFRFVEMMFYDRILMDGMNPYEVYRKGGLRTWQPIRI